MQLSHLDHWLEFDVRGLARRAHFLLLPMNQMLSKLKLTHAVT